MAIASTGIERLSPTHYVSVTRNQVAVLSNTKSIERAVPSQAVLYGRSEAKQQAVTPDGHDSGQRPKGTTQGGRSTAIREPLDPDLYPRTKAPCCCRGGHVQAEYRDWPGPATGGPHPARPLRGNPGRAAAAPRAGGARGSPAGSATCARGKAQLRINADHHTGN